MTRPLSAQDKAALLETVPMFRDFPWQELCTIATFMNFQKTAAGGYLVKEGDTGASLAVLVDGVVTIVKRSHTGREVQLGDIHKGNVVGEMSMLDGEPRSASLYAQTDLKLLVLAKTELDAILKADPALGAKLLAALARTLSVRLRKATGQLARVGHGFFPSP